MKCDLLILGLLAFSQLLEVRAYEIVFPRKVRSVFKRDTQNIYPDVLQYEISLGGNSTLIHIEKTEDLFGKNYTESHYLENGTLVTNSPEYQDHCHYQGHVKNESDSVVTLSTCNGLSGLIQIREKRFLIEPLNFTDSDEHAVHEHVPVLNITCGVADGPAPRKPPSIASFRASDFEKDNLWQSRKYVELFIVADQSMYNKYDQDIQKINQRLFGIVNHMNTYYKQINIFVALIGTEIWNAGDQIQVVSDYNVLLKRFTDWRVQTLLPRKPHDNAQFLTHVDFDDTTVGLAALSVMCDTQSTGIIQDDNRLATFIGATMAHEMGHNLGMAHDNLGCTCSSGPCVMIGTLTTSLPRMFSSCSIKDFRSFIYANFPTCLLNAPQASDVLNPPVCGNKFIEGEEQCDCGDPQECTSNCCDASICKLKPGCQCDEGLCCQNCKIKPAGSTCRPAKDECDLADLCDGTSPVCAKDSFKLNGSPCMDGKGFCYKGKCPHPSSQCVDIWGPGSIAGDDQCFAGNAEGSIRGHCRKEGQKYIPCAKEDVNCGLLYCIGGSSSPSVKGYLIEFKNCKTFVFDGGMVATGTKCSATNVCMNGKCSSVEDSYMTANCQAKCTGHAVCDHDLECRCEKGWMPPNCMVRMDETPQAVPPNSTVRPVVTPHGMPPNRTVRTDETPHGIQTTTPAFSSLQLTLCPWWWTLLLLFSSMLMSICE